MPSIRKYVEKLPFRFFGPVSEAEADNIVEVLLDDEDLRDTLKAFASGEIEPRELAYQIQCLMECTSEQIFNAGPDAMDSYHEAKERGAL